MNAKIKKTNTSGRCNRAAQVLLAACCLAFGALTGQPVRAADIQWNVGAGTWTNTANWVGGVVPGIADNADFNTSLITGNPNVTINVAPASTLQVGSVTAGSSIASNFRITAQSSAVNPTTLALNGVGGILLSNYSSSYQMIITNSTVTSPPFLYLAISNSGAIYANNGLGLTPPKDASGGEIVIYSVITGSGNITNVGGGILYLATTNTYTGSTTLSAGTLEMGASGTIGNGTGTLYFAGGNLETGGSSTTRIIANPIVVNAPGNAYIYNASGTAGTRVFAFSGSLTGTSGTLVLGNVNTTASEYLDVELSGSFTFNLPLVVGDNLGDSYSDNYPSDYSELQLVNSAAIGPQIFNGNISGDGPIIRGNLPSVSVAGDNGTTIFTGSNSYSGGTFVNNGRLFANNAAGSALGTGAVTVTNTGTLSGNGFIAAPTTIYLNGTIQPGSTTNTTGKLTVSSGLTFNAGANYTCQISAATGTPGTAWDLIDASGSGWTDAGGTPAININVTSQGIPAGWNSANSYSWMIITNNGGTTGFTPSHWAINTSGFGGSVAGVFGVTNDANGDLLLTYTPTSGSITIDVESGSVNQGAVSPTPYPVLSGLNSVVKVGNGEVVLTNSQNSYQGTTYIDAGTASAAVDSTTGGGSFGASTAPIVLGNTTGVSSNATLNIDVPGVTIANAVTVQSGNSGVKTIGTTITSGGATNSGNITLNDNVTLSAPVGGSDYFAGTFSGPGGITFAGGGAITMAGVGSYGGPSTLTGGTTLYLNASALGTNTFTISAASTLDNTSGGSVTLANNPPQIWNGDINFAGTGNLNLGTGPVTMGSSRTLNLTNGILTVGGTIAGTGFGLTKTGAGELVLSASTNSTYTGGTTNQGGLIAINGTATFGDGTGTLVFSGGNLLDTSTRAGLPIANPVIISANTRVYGNSTDTSAPNRYLPFIGPFTVTNGATLYIDNIGSAKTIFDFGLQGGNFTTVNWPIVIGDPSFDTAGALTVLNLVNSNNTPVETISSLISGTGSILRGGGTVNTGGTTILTAQNTFSGGVQLNAGALGVGASSVVSGGSVVSGPLGTGLLTIGASNSETNLTIFATGGATEIDNAVYFNGNTNITFAGTNNLLFTGPVNSGNATKTLNVTNGITTTFSGAITNTGSSGGGSLIKAGGGTLIFSGTNTYIGSTTVSAGTLLVNGALGTNVVTVNPAGTFGGTGATGGNVNFASGAQAYFFKSAGASDTPLTIAGNLTFNGNTVVVDLGGTTTLGLGTYNLISYAGTLSGALNATPTIVDGSLAGGKVASIDLSTPNQVNLIVTAGTTPSTPPNFTPGGIVRLPNGGISLVVTGALNTPFRLWATTNLNLKPVTNTWTLLNSGTVSSSPFTNMDLTATNFVQRFYLFTTP
jgi:autotransporter-associated beta strand protein